jgi:ABC-type iron transport system FetAB permease component
VEMKLSLGANYREASEDMVRRAMKAGMIPAIEFKRDKENPAWPIT